MMENRKPPSIELFLIHYCMKRTSGVNIEVQEIKFSVIVIVFFIQNLKILIIYSYFPDQIILKPPYFYT